MKTHFDIDLLNENLTEYRDAVYRLLKQKPDGLSEYELLGELGKEGYGKFMAGVFHEQLKLFQGHFILFHTLYRLRDKIRGDGGELFIHSLEIKYVPCYIHPQEEAVSIRDKLYDYYMDLTHLATTSEDDVAELLNSFYKKLKNYPKRKEALAILGLADPVSLSKVKNRYRQLVKQHHPDQNGDDGEMIRKLNFAMEVLNNDPMLMPDA